jgi:hypothetical protein
VKEIAILDLAVKYHLAFRSDGLYYTGFREDAEIKEEILSFARALLRKERSNAKKRQTKSINVKQVSSSQVSFSPLSGIQEPHAT